MASFDPRHPSAEIVTFHYKGHLNTGIVVENFAGRVSVRYNAGNDDIGTLLAYGRPQLCNVRPEAIHMRPATLDEAAAFLARWDQQAAVVAQSVEARMLGNADRMAAHLAAGQIAADEDC